MFKLDIPCSSASRRELPREPCRAGRWLWGTLTLGAQPARPLLLAGGRGSQAAAYRWQNNSRCKQHLCACLSSLPRPPPTTSSHQQEWKHLKGFARCSPAAFPGRAGEPERWNPTTASPRPAGIGSPATATATFISTPKRLPGSGR